MQGIARSERMDLMVQKATELGVAAILPVTTARSVVRLDRDTRERKLAHWRGIAVAACEQCGRARIPTIGVPAAARRAASARPPPGRASCSRPDAALSLADAARGRARRSRCSSGPEGGLEDGERDAALAAGFRACRLGPRVLRSETAAIAALAILQSVAGDLG